MTKVPWAVSIGLIVAGFLFAASSANTYRNGETIWGFAVTGLVCIIFGSTFALLIWNRSTHPGMKVGQKHPLE